MDYFVQDIARQNPLGAMRDSNVCLTPLLAVRREAKVGALFGEPPCHLLGRADGRRGLKYDDIPALQHRRDRTAGALDIVQVRFMVLFERSRHGDQERSEEHTSELQSLMRISYAVFCL